MPWIDNPGGFDPLEHVTKHANLIWDSSSLAWIKETGTPAGAVNVTVINGGLSLPVYDYAALAAAATSDVWTFRTGGALGVIVATVTINYTDATKSTIINVAKT